MFVVITRDGILFFEKHRMPNLDRLTSRFGKS